MKVRKLCTTDRPLVPAWFPVIYMYFIIPNSQGSEFPTQMYCIILKYVRISNRDIPQYKDSFQATCTRSNKQIHDSNTDSSTYYHASLSPTASK